jgi:uncharacterized protein (TIGR02145 family)
MRKKLSILSLIISLVLISGCASYNSSETSFKDPRDGHEYATVKIDNLIWMLDNLSYDIKGSYCYGDIKSNCNTYGKLYTWEVAFDACPPGWRLPTENEMKRLVEFFGSPGKVADILTKVPPEGFNADYAGSRYYNGEYAGIGEYVVFWTSAEIDTEKAVCLSIEKTGEERITWPEYLRKAAFSVRCVRKAY